MRIEVSKGQETKEPVVRLRLEQCPGGVKVMDDELGGIIGMYWPEGYKPAFGASSCALPTDSKGRVKVMGYKPLDEIEPNPWIPVESMEGIPEGCKDGRDVEVTFSGRVRVIKYSSMLGHWEYSGAIVRFSWSDGYHVCAYRLPTPYKGGE